MAKVIIYYFLNFDQNLWVTRNSLSLRRELFLLVVEALHCSGSHSACRAAHFLLAEEDHRTGLTLGLSLLNLSRFLCYCSKWTHQSVLEILQHMRGLEVLACSMGTDLNYCSIYSSSIFKPVVMFLFIILCILEKQKVSKPVVSGRVEIQNFPGAFFPGSWPGLCSGPAGGFTVPPVP